MKMKFARIYKKSALLLAVLLMLTSLTGCKDLVKELSKKSQNTGKYPVVVGTVEIKAPPKKVAVLSASLADVIVALQYEANLVAVDNTCTQPELDEVTKVAPTDVDAINAAAPDLILTETLTADQKKELNGVSVPIVEIARANSRTDYERLFGEVSSIFSGSGLGYDAGVLAAQKLFVVMDSIQRLSASNVVTTACYIYDLNGKAVTGNDFGDIVMQYAGLTNAFSSLSDQPYDAKNLKTQNPTVIFCAPGLKDKLKTDAQFAQLDAVKNDRVKELDPSMVEWQGRTIITGATYMAEFAFPQLSKEQTTEVADPTKEIDKKAKENLDNMQKETYDTLEPGTKNDAVSRLQQRLVELHYLDSYDGDYGEGTKQAISAFQTANSLTVTGTADNATQQLLYSESAIASPNYKPGNTAAPQQTDSQSGSE